MSRVYFLRGGGAIKIGVSTDVDKRIRVLRFNSPVKLKLLGSIEATASFEKALHHKLAEHRLKGEWFSYVPAVRSVVDAVLAHGVAAIEYHEPELSAPVEEVPVLPQRPFAPMQVDVWLGFPRQIKALFDDYIVDICRAPSGTAAEMLAALRQAINDIEEMMDNRADPEMGAARVQSLAAELAALSPWNPPHSG